MGLDISYYRNLKPLPSGTDEDEDRDIFLSDSGFKGRMDSLTEGPYEGEEVGNFRAGSYSGYGHWRALLCRMAHGTGPEAIWENLEAYQGKPFFELINFSDCEGTIGPATSTKLYGDFVTFDEQAKSFSETECMYGRPEYFYDLYKEWKEAFRVASEENGAVAFH